MTAPARPPGDHLAHRVALTPDRIALVDAAADEQWTYAALDARVDRLAGGLQAAGIGAGDRVGTLFQVGPHTFRATFATTRVGAVTVPLDPRLPAETLTDRLDIADVDLLLCSPATAAVAAESCGTRPVRSVTPVDGSVSSLARDAPVERIGRGPDKTQLLVYTSGSTGTPKLVRLTVANLRASAVASASRLGVERTDRWYDPLPPWHVGGLSPALRCTLYGTTVVVGRSFAPADAGAHLDQYEITCLSLVPTMLRRMLDRAGGITALAAPRLRFVLTGGAPTPPALVERCAEVGVPVAPTYGMTETASQIATAPPEIAARDSSTVGPPLRSTAVTIVDATGERVDPGTPGEILVDGPAVSPGYAAGGDDRWSQHGFRTGDLGRLDDEYLYVTGRVDDRIVTGGETVDPTEVATTLTEHPAVAEAVVVGVPDPDWGERVGALVVPVPDSTPSTTALETFCAERLAGYKRPRTVVLTDAIPRTASGSVDRAAVVDRLAESA